MPLSPSDMNQIRVVYVIYKITSVTSNLKSFWSSASNKVASTNFLQKSFLKEIDVILSGYMIVFMVSILINALWQE